MRLHGGVNRLDKHQSLDAHASVASLRQIIAMFRPPDERLASTHAWIQATEGHCCDQATFRWEGGWKTEREVKRRILAGAPPNETVGAFTGCMTHMLLGHGCMSRHQYAQPSRHVAARAIGRLANLFFVGLTHRWRLSICLLNFKLTGERFVFPQQLVNCRPTPHQATGASRGRGGRDADGEEGGQSLHGDAQRREGLGGAGSSDGAPGAPDALGADALDDAVYRFARARFETELARHGIEEATCPLRGPELVVGCNVILKPRATVRLYML